jgi:hypothetical protein
VSASPPIRPGEIPAERIRVRSASPLLISLRTHDIRPKPGADVPLARPEDARDRKKAASVSVSFDLVLKRRP